MKNKRITITAARVFSENILFENSGTGFQYIQIGDLPDYNLVDLEAVKKLYDETRPDIVFIWLPSRASASIRKTLRRSFMTIS